MGVALQLNPKPTSGPAPAPAGIILEYESKGQVGNKSIDLLDLSSHSDLDMLCTFIVRQEPLVSEKRKPALKQLLAKVCFLCIGFIHISMVHCTSIHR